MEGKDKAERFIAAEGIRGALIDASEHGHIAIVRALDEHGVDADALIAALRCSVTGDNKTTELTEYLLDCGADANAVQAGPYGNGNSYNALTLACTRGSTFHPPPASPRSLPESERPARYPLHWRQLYIAVVALHEVVEILLEYGANHNQVLIDGNTALLEVLQERDHAASLETFSLLLQYHADPNLAHATTGVTPLMAAALACRVEYVNLLLEYEANVTQANAAGQSVLDMLGRTRKYSEVVELCTSYIDSNLPGAAQIPK